MKGKGQEQRLQVQLSEHQSQGSWQALRLMLMSSQRLYLAMFAQAQQTAMELQTLARARVAAEEKVSEGSFESLFSLCAAATPAVVAAEFVAAVQLSEDLTGNTVYGILFLNCLSLPGNFVLLSISGFRQ